MDARIGSDPHEKGFLAEVMIISGVYSLLMR